jgi:CTP-dependent riboflavin kinase
MGRSFRPTSLDPADQVELLCEIHLRESLSLSDGDSIGFSALP